jgi:hypothetical protein
VLAWSGINDNGSGSAGILEVALDMEKVQPTATRPLRLVGLPRRLGLLGSRGTYVDS